MNSSDYFIKTLMPAYGLGPELLGALHECNGRFWGSAVVRAMHGEGAVAPWEPNDIDILVADKDAAAAVEKSLGYGNKIIVGPSDELLGDHEVSERFAAAVPIVWYFQQWRDVPTNIPDYSIRARRVVKVWIGDFDKAMAAADLSCCRVAATVEADGRLKFHGRTDGTFRVLDGDPDDGDIYSRITKYKRRLGIE
jgi:hypothetical protein